jgi:hypothetical protein
MPKELSNTKSGKDVTKVLVERKEGQPPTEEVDSFNPYSRPIGTLEQ